MPSLRVSVVISSDPIFPQNSPPELKSQHSLLSNMAEKLTASSSADAPSVQEQGLVALSTTTTDDLIGRKVSRLRGISVIFTLSGINFLNTMGSGILIAALPHIASDVGLPDSLILVSFLSPHQQLQSPVRPRGQIARKTIH